MFGSAWCLVMRKPNSYFSLIAKIKIERPELLLTLPPTYVQKHLIFVFSPPPSQTHTPESSRHKCVIPSRHTAYMRHEHIVIKNRKPF